MQQLSHQSARVIAVASGKGGVGKTNVAVNLGVALGERGHRVTLLDADLGLAGIDVLLGLKPHRTIRDVLGGACTLADALTPGPCGLQVLPAASGDRALADLGPREHAGLIAAFSEISMDTDVLLIDTAAGISDQVTSFLSAAQEVLVVVDDEPTAVSAAYALISVLNRDCGVDRIRVLANSVRGERHGAALFAKLETLASRLLDVALGYAGAIPFDHRLRRAVQRQRSVLEAYPECPASRAFGALARDVDRWPAATAPRGRVEFFMERLLADSAMLH